MVLDLLLCGSAIAVLSCTWTRICQLDCSTSVDNQWCEELFLQDNIDIIRAVITLSYIYYRGNPFSFHRFHLKSSTKILRYSYINSSIFINFIIFVYLPPKVDACCFVEPATFCTVDVPEDEHAPQGRQQQM